MKLKIGFKSGREIVVLTDTATFKKWFDSEHRDHTNTSPAQFWSFNNTIAWDWNQVESVEVIQQ